MNGDKVSCRFENPGRIRDDFEKHCVSVPSATRPGRPVGPGSRVLLKSTWWGSFDESDTTGALCLQSTVGSHCDSSRLRFR